MSSFSPPDPSGQSSGNVPPPIVGPDLKIVATQQRTIMLCLLANIVLLALKMVFAKSELPALMIVLNLLYLGIGITGAVFVVKLAMSLYNTALGIVFGILALIPLVGLLFLLMVNNKATTLLRSRGIRVGLLGADPHSFG